ncbi:MAG: universal stress protein [Anaerolineaceae bacterium]|nr:universal stress protein [Anaerolineaceae bacterium]
MRILIVVHGLPNDEVTLHLSAQFAHQAGAAITVLAVAGHARDRASLEPALARAREVLAQAPILESKVRLGSSVHEVVREAEEDGYDLVLVGEPWHEGRFGRFRPGSESVHLVEHAPCSVLVVKGKPRAVRRILLCDSGAGSVLADPVLRATRVGPPLLARFTAQAADMLRGEEEITVLHVMSQIGAGPGIADGHLRAAAEELIEERAPEGELLIQDVQLLVRPGVQARPLVRHGLVLDEILHEARCGDYDLVVIGAHPGKLWQKLLLDDLARKIMVQIDRPILVIK